MISYLDPKLFRLASASQNLLIYYDLQKLYNSPIWVRIRHSYWSWCKSLRWKEWIISCKCSLAVVIGVDDGAELSWNCVEVEGGKVCDELMNEVLSLNTSLGNTPLDPDPGMLEFAPNVTTPRLGETKCTGNLIWESPRSVPFGPNLTHFRAKPDTPA